MKRTRYKDVINMGVEVVYSLELKDGLDGTENLILSNQHVILFHENVHKHVI